MFEPWDYTSEWIAHMVLTTHCRQRSLTGWGQNKMTANSQTTFSNIFFGMGILVCWFQFDPFHWRISAPPGFSVLKLTLPSWIKDNSDAAVIDICYQIQRVSWSLSFFTKYIIRGSSFSSTIRARYVMGFFMDPKCDLCCIFAIVVLYAICVILDRVVAGLDNVRRNVKQIGSDEICHG